MAITDKPTALQTDKEVTTSMFESFLTPEEDKVEDAVTETEEVTQEEVIEDDVQIIEVSRNSSPEKISSLIEVEATQIVGDLMGLGIMKAIDTPLDDSDIEKLFEKYNLIPDLIDEVTISREDIKAMMPTVEQEIENEKQAKIDAKVSGNQKLLDLGLTQAEATALTGYTPPSED